MTQNLISLIFADDHPVFRSGLVHLIRTDPAFSLLGEAEHGGSALALIETHKPDVALLDIAMPVLTGLQVAAAVQERHLSTQIAILTMYNDSLLFNKAMDIGVMGYLLKENAAGEILNCLKTVAGGQYYISPSMSGLLLERSQRRQTALSVIPGLALLTPTEVRILKFIAGNKTSKDIAADLCISYKTVENHRSNIAEKLNLHGNNALLRFALEHKSIL